MKLRLLMAAPLLSFFALAACSTPSPSPSTSSSSSVYCSETPNIGAMSCYGYKDLTPQQHAAFTYACGGSVVSSCPTVDLIGCCTSSQGGEGVVEENCFYTTDAGGENASGLQSNCTSAGATWSTTAW